MSVVMRFVVVSTILFAGAVASFAAEPAEILDVWPGKPPSESGDIGEETAKEPDPTKKYTSRNITNVTRPTLSTYRPAPGKNNGAALLIAPGGGYNILAFDKEGIEVAEWAASLGMTGIVLKYRVPRRPDTPASSPPVQPLQDAQRAVAMVRSRASEWGIDPNKIGFLGFSAGGHLCANVATHFDKRAYEPVDALDQVNCRPDFAVAIYPGGIVDRETKVMSPDLIVTDKTPPMFLAHAIDDKVPCENSIEMFLALKKAGIPAELHVYASGGHGYGLRPTSHAGANWPSACEQWLRDIKVLPAK